jgi:hypothetical protein
MSAATRENVILAYENNGEPLIGVLRLIVPGEWGYKWISQVTHIVLVDYDFKGRWESIGYPDDANIQSGTDPLAGVQFDPRKPLPQNPNTIQSPSDAKPSNSTPAISTPQPSNSSTALPSEDTQSSMPNPKPAPSESLTKELFASIIVAVGVSAGLLAYIKKRNHRLTSAT